ncbi:MAG: hypothetical protein HYS13_17625 [Planctomycetia bacterium]|nr:hypothetical protein [Planctomycetia bacterium]
MATLVDYRDRPPKLLVVLLAVVVAASVPAAFFWGRSLAPVGKLTIQVALAAFVTLLLIAWSKATAKGTLLGVHFNIRGAGASFVITFVLFYVCFPKPDATAVRIFLMHQGVVLNQRFSVIIHPQQGESISKESSNGEVTVELPSHVTQLDDVTLKCPGFRLKSKPPFYIENSIVRLAVVKSESLPPLRPEDFPHLSALTDLPTEEQVSREPAVSPSEVTLFYRNLCDDNLRLLLFDCSRHYKIVRGEIKGGSPWLDFPLDVSDEYTPYQFETGTGWYCFFVRDSTGKNHCLRPWACRNLFQTRETKLTIRQTEDGNFEAVLD